MSILRASRRLSPPLRSTPPTRSAVTKKSERQQTILRLISEHSVASQEDLRQRMAENGWAVTQATLSRDLRDLGIVRAPTDDGARYMLPEMLSDEAKVTLESLLPQWFSRIDGVSELIVLHTLPSGAQPIAEAIDYEEWPEVLGTLAGENTVLIICRSSDARSTVVERIERLAESA
jgi:transcriptional regulator of arginine metabolism